jgi:hypothetical protein
LVEFVHQYPLKLMERAIAHNKLPSFSETQRALAHFPPYDMLTRLLYGQRFGYGIPCAETIAMIARFLEVGAGSGFWSYWLRLAGCDVIATDPSDHPSPWLSDVRRLDAIEALRTFGGRAVLMVWPHFTADWPAALVRELPGDAILCYAGEGPFGCCAANSFFSSLGARGFTMSSLHPSPSWPPNPDYLAVYCGPAVFRGQPAERA